MTDKSIIQERIDQLENLSPREKEILTLFGLGLSRSDMAHATSRNPKTIDSHRNHIMEKLHVRNNTDIILFAIQTGLVRPEHCIIQDTRARLPKAAILEREYPDFFRSLSEKILLPEARPHELERV